MATVGDESNIPIDGCGVSLATIGGGAAVELFNIELAKVLNNIVDENTDPEAMREVVLKVKLKPDSDRDSAKVQISAQAKLAPINSFSTNFFIGKNRGKGIAQEHNPKQAKFVFEKPEITAVAPKEAIVQ